MALPKALMLPTPYFVVQTEKIPLDDIKPYTTGYKQQKPEGFLLQALR